MTALVENVLPQDIYSQWNISFHSPTVPSYHHSYPTTTSNTSSSTYVSPTPIHLSNPKSNSIHSTRWFTPTSLSLTPSPSPSSSLSFSSSLGVVPEKKKLKKVNFKPELVIVYPVQKYPHIFYTHEKEIMQFQTWVPDTPPSHSINKSNLYRTCPSAKHLPLTSILRKPRHSIITIFDDSLPFDTTQDTKTTWVHSSSRIHCGAASTTPTMLSLSWNLWSAVPSVPSKIKNTLHYLSYQIGSWCTASYNEKSRL